MSIFLFFIVLFVLILVHEWGHFIAAKKTGMRVDEFGIGFPPRLFGVKKGETEYTFNALPIGGFVRIYGENAEDAARDAGSGGDASRSFTAKSKLAQAIVLVAGVTMNVLFAWVLIAVALMIGVPTTIDEATAGSEARLYVQGVLPGGPAAAAGLPAGAIITEVSIGETVVTADTPSSFRSVTEGSGDAPLLITYEAPGGTLETVTVQPMAGIVSDDAERVAIGVSLAMIETVRESFIGALYEAGIRTAVLLQAITVGITTLIVDTFQGQADFSAVTGPVGIVGIVGDAAAFGFTSLILLTAMISLNLAVINMLPFPALDGGRLVFVAIESVIRRPIAPVWVARLNGLGFLLLMALMVAVTYKDIVTRL